MWEVFKKRAEARGVTFREAMEAAIRNLADAVKLEAPVIWPHTKTGKSHPIQMHFEVRDVMHGLVEQTGYKQNIVVLAAMQRWMEKTE
jgi:hypothetical protein